ncbi:uncharacterized protein [Chlorocebus sabaeus]|uniref:uncharacterized protein isoform X2 n=1 Tax=Chlorocebus sabaeus TaxID=60711 RepID=UPI003BF98676
MMASPSFLTGRGPKSHLKRSPETPAEALRLPLHRWKSAPGGPEDRTPGILLLGCPRPLLPRRPLLEPGSGRRRGCGGSPQRPPPTPPRFPVPLRAHAPSHPIPGPGAPRSRRCLKGPQPDFQVGSASGPGAPGPVRMREAPAASRVTAVPTVVLETSPLRLSKAGALRGGAWVSGLRGSCLTSPRGRQESLRTDAGSRNAPARRTKPQAESGGRGASSQHQACPDGVGERLRTDAGSRNAPARRTKPQPESRGRGASSQHQACPDGVGERLRTDAGSRNAPARRTKPQAESGGRGASSQHQACPDGVGERLRTDAGSRNAPARRTKPQAESGGRGASSQHQACPDGVGERLRTDAGSRNAPARRTKPQAESGGRGASSQHQACPDGVGESLRTDAGSRNAPAGRTKPQAESGGRDASSQHQACPDGVGVETPSHKVKHSPLQNPRVGAGDVTEITRAANSHPGGAQTDPAPQALLQTQARE